MLDSDISTDDAVRLLHRPEGDDRLTVDRRRFLQLVGMGMGAGLVAGGSGTLLDELLLGHDPSAWAAGPVGATDGIVVVWACSAATTGSTPSSRPPTATTTRSTAGWRSRRAAPAVRRLDRPPSQPHGVQAVLGSGRAGDRRGHRLPQPRPVALQLDGVLDVRADERHPDVGVARAMARRSPVRCARPVRRRRDRLVAPAPHDRSEPAGHHRADVAAVVRGEHPAARPADVRRAARHVHGGARSVARRRVAGLRRTARSSPPSWRPSTRPSATRSRSSGGSRSPPG